MTATAAMIAEVRRKTAELTEVNYSDDVIQAQIEEYPLIDERGEEPFTFDTSTQPPTEDPNEDWIPTYDLNAAAADVWVWKAGLIVGNFDFAADGGNFKRNQGYENAMRQSRHFRSRRSPSTITQEPWPRETGQDFVFNRNDPQE